MKRARLVATRLARELTRLRKDGRAALLWSLRITVAAVASYVVGDAVLPRHPAAARAADGDARRAGHPGLAAGQRPRPGGGGGGRVSRSRWRSPPSYRCEWWSLGLLILRLASRSARCCGCARTSSRSRSAACSCSASARSAPSPPPGSGSRRRWSAPPSGIAANLLFPPKVASADAGRAIDGLADAVERPAEPGRRRADRAGRPRAATWRRRARAWLDDARRITHDIPRGRRRAAARRAGPPAQRPRRRHARRGAGAAAGPRGAGALRGRDPQHVPRAGRRDVTTRSGSTTRPPRTCCSGWPRRSGSWRPASTRSAQLVRDEADPATG